MSSQAKKPLNVLQNAVGKRVTIRLKTDVEYRGDMENVDAFMNVILTDAEEFTGNEHATKYGKVIVRGDNVLFIQIADDIL